MVCLKFVVVFVVVVAVVVIETLLPKAYSRVALASGSSLSGSVVRNLRAEKDF